MADSYAPPPGPPPPKVPEGWKAQFNDQYKEWFYVNIYTKKSQWDKPTEPVYPPGEHPDGAPPGPPPNYDEKSAKPVGAEKGGNLSSNNPYAPGGPGTSGGSHANISEDEALARKLQEEENARGGGSGANRGASDSYYQQGGAPQYGQQQPFGQQQYGGPGFGGPSPGPQQQWAPPQEKGKSKGGFLGKLLGKSSSNQSHGYPQQQYYGGPPQGQYGYAPQQGYYGNQGYPPGGYAQQGKKPGGGGMGMAGGAALGVGAGLIGGALIADAIDDHEEHEAYDQGYDDGQDNDYGGGDDFGGGDF